jgi:23S rRNA (cytidine1920-2'-O)/16S rRNA (cytidine1409-2'-O)-methyltransferase
MAEAYKGRYNGDMRKKRLDVLLTERGLAGTPSQAQRFIMAGQVRVDGQLVWLPAHTFPPTVAIELHMGPRYVSRGGEKLEAALAAFELTRLDGRVCVDVGASTGGFTDCLLQHGAGKVYAVDVGYGVLHWKLRSDPRVVLMERTNARHLKSFPEPISLVTIDASFISLRVLLPVVQSWFSAGSGEVVALIKPQFEAGREEVSRGEGVVQDPDVHRQVLHEVLAHSRDQGFALHGLIRSPLKGPKGNIEFLLHLKTGQESPLALEDLVAQAMVPAKEALSDGEEPAEGEN